jgi:hypothetical protein
LSLNIYTSELTVASREAVFFRNVNLIYRLSIYISSSLCFHEPGIYIPSRLP